MSWLLAAFFLPLFPMSMVFNLLLQKTPNAVLRSILLLAWPLTGLFLVIEFRLSVPSFVVVWALATAALYAFRAIVIRDMGVWIGYIATSVWALIWIAADSGVEGDALKQHVLAFSLPLAMLVLLTAEVERRYGAAFAGVVAGVASAQPRLAGLIVMTILAAIGSPLFPAFFTMLDSLVHTVAISPWITSGVAIVWLLWSWAAMKLLQELLVGEPSAVKHVDLSMGMTVTYSVLLSALLVSGLYLPGAIL